MCTYEKTQQVGMSSKYIINLAFSVLKLSVWISDPVNNRQTIGETCRHRRRQLHIGWMNK
jgi:hypothetical protein